MQVVCELRHNWQKRMPNGEIQRMPGPDDEKLSLSMESAETCVGKPVL